MWGFVRGSDVAALALAALLAAGGGAGAEVPARVVSVNLCTDQLAMLLADEGQLVSVTWLAADPRASAMPAAALAYTPNRGQAEQVFLMRPDLVLAGTYTARPTVDLLRRLGVRVVEFPPVSSLADVTAQMRGVGAALGQGARAEAMVAAFEAGLAALLPPPGDADRSAAIYQPNGYTSGAGTMGNEILTATGFRNIGAAEGLTGGGTLPLERLVMAAPDLVVTSAPYPAASRAEELLDHPALASLRARTGVAVLSDADWVCGTPYLLNAVAALAAARATMTGEAGE